MIYFDSAATTLQKPPSVARSVSHAMSHMATPGRGGHRPAMRAGEVAFACRMAAAEFFHVPDPQNVIFTFNATHGLNIAIKTLVKEGDTVLISGFEHNAVTRPLAAIPRVTIKVASSPLFSPELFLQQFEQKLTGEVAAVICTHVSNVFGYILPIFEVAALCRRRGVPLIVDASQSAGALPVHMEEWGADFIAMPGHKGLYGPQGTGLLLCGQIPPKPLLEGGSGSVSLLQQMPDFLPDRLEAGTHNIAGIAGLLEGLRYLERVGLDTVFNHEKALIQKLALGLEKIPGIQVFRDSTEEHQSGVLSFCVDGVDCETVGEELGRRDIAVRAGLHCAPLAHHSAGTLACGTVRCSVSAFNTGREVDRFLQVGKQLPRLN
jgi:cysteine desulfurase family protein